MSRRKHVFAGFAALLSGVYLVLAVASVACAAEHESLPSGHHHGGTLAHSGVCAWACQADPTSDAGPSTLVLHPFFLVAFSIEESPAAIAGGGLFSAASRGPPQS